MRKKARCLSHDHTFFFTYRESAGNIVTPPLGSDCCLSRYLHESDTVARDLAGQRMIRAEPVRRTRLGLDTVIGSSCPLHQGNAVLKKVMREIRRYDSDVDFAPGAGRTRRPGTVQIRSLHSQALTNDCQKSLNAGYDNWCDLLHVFRHECTVPVEARCPQRSWRAHHSVL